MSIEVKSNNGTLKGYGKVIRKDGTTEEFTIDTIVTKEQADKFKMHLEKNKSESQKQIK